MTESVPPTLKQTQQLHRSLTEKVLDKAASDPAWKQQLLDDPEAAMRGANFPEAQQLEQWRQGARYFQGGEVRGQSSGHWLIPWWKSLSEECPWQCSSYTYYWYKSW